MSDNMTYEEWLAHAKATVKKNKGNIQKSAMEFGIAPASFRAVVKGEVPGYTTFHKWLDANKTK